MLKIKDTIKGGYKTFFSIEFLVPEDVYEPLKVSVRGADPEEVDLLARHP